MQESGASRIHTRRHQIFGEREGLSSRCSVIHIAKELDVILIQEVQELMRSESCV